jgi:mRNA interferase HigB
MGEFKRGKLMRINHWGRARQFIEQHPEAGSSLGTWKRAVIEASWTNFTDVKRTCNSVDWYQGALIFDIGGNNIRLIAVCRFELGRLYIDKVLTHDEYDNGTWKKRYLKKKR